MGPGVPAPAANAAAPVAQVAPVAPVAGPQPAAQPQPAATLVPAAATAAAAPTNPTAPPTSPPARLDAVEARSAAGRELLAAGSSARYSVQLMVTDPREREYLDAYLAEAARLVEPGRLYVVAAGSPQMPRVGVLYGAFEARAQAAEALAALPAPLRQFRPYVRSVDALREEARRAQ